MIAAMLEPGEVRKRLKQRMESCGGTRPRGGRRLIEAERDYEAFLETHAVPVFRHLASALRAGGALFQVCTPAGSVRLASERSKDDFIEVALDPARQPVEVVGRTSFTLGTASDDEEAVREGRARRISPTKTCWSSRCVCCAVPRAVSGIGSRECRDA